MKKKHFHFDASHEVVGISVFVCRATTRMIHPTEAPRISNINKKKKSSLNLYSAVTKTIEGLEQLVLDEALAFGRQS